MTIRNLDQVFRPRVVAVVGASDQPGKVGHTLLKNLLEHGYTGRVYPINATRDVVQGMTAFRDLSLLPEKPDLAVICTPSTTVPALIEQCGQLGIMGVVIISAGFREVGPEGMQLEEQIREIQKRYPGLRVVGPQFTRMSPTGVSNETSHPSDVGLFGAIRQSQPTHAVADRRKEPLRFVVVGHSALPCRLSQTTAVHCFQRFRLRG